MAQNADLIITNAKIFTSDVHQAWAEAVAIGGNKILFVGKADEVKQYRGGNTRVVDGQNATVTPGLIDCHFHLLLGSIESASAQLQQVKTKDDLRKVLLAFAEEDKTSAWVMGGGIKYSIVSIRQELDAIISDRPVYIGAYDGHTSWANTKALEMAGILYKGEAPGNGVIVRDEHNMATGELRETAMDMVSNLIPLPDEKRKHALFISALKRINSTGVTSVHNMNGDMDELTFYVEREAAGELTLRVYTPLWVKPEMTENDLQEAAAMAKVQGEYARGGAVKFFMDGVWESYTALNLEPYADDANAKVDGIYTAEHFNRMTAACDKLGLQIFVHCCGDGAVRRVLDGYEYVQKTNGKRDSRHRVEHIEVIHPDDLPRFKQLGVIASMQTSHAPYNVGVGDVWMERVGQKRWPRSFAWRDIKNAGAMVILGSDWTVAPFDPLINIFVAMNRKKWAPTDPDQRLTLEECLLGYTREAAFGEFKEKEKGQLKEGYLADLVLFDHDLFQVKPEDIMTAKVAMTIVDGKIVYEA
jgi:predicted amidohydrolase YtcJ